MATERKPPMSGITRKIFLALFVLSVVFLIESLLPF